MICSDWGPYPSSECISCDPGCKYIYIFPCGEECLPCKMFYMLSQLHSSRWGLVTPRQTFAICKENGPVGMNGRRIMV